MNAPLIITDRDGLRQKLAALCAALDNGDDALFESCLAQLLREREESLFVRVAQLTRKLHDAMTGLQLDSQLSQLAGADIPDARSRLDYIARLGETAAHRTLDLVERCQKNVQTLAASSGASEPLVELRAHLSELAQAQEYQDLSGQVIQRVTRLVQNVEGALLELLRAAGSHTVGRPVAATVGTARPTELLGPGSKSGNSQEDADALLSSLGF